MNKIEFLFKMPQCFGAGDYLLNEKNIPELNSIFADIGRHTDFIDLNDEEDAKNKAKGYERIKELGEIEIYNALMCGDLVVDN